MPDSSAPSGQSSVLQARSRDSDVINMDKSVFQRSQSEAGVILRRADSHSPGGSVVPSLSETEVILGVQNCKQQHHKSTTHAQRDRNSDEHCTYNGTRQQVSLPPGSKHLNRIQQTKRAASLTASVMCNGGKTPSDTGSHTGINGHSVVTSGVKQEQPAGSTSLHKLIARQQFESASVVIQGGAVIDMQDDQGLVPLDYCLSMSHRPPDGDSVLEFFAKHAADIAQCRLKSERNAACILAYWDAHGLLSQVLHGDRASAWFRDKHKQCPLHYCFSRDDHISVQSAQALVSAGGDINEKNVDGATPLHFLASHNLAATPVVEHFVCDIVDSHALKEDMSPLHLAAASGDSELIQYVARCGVDLNVCDKDGFTPLHLASLHGHHDVIQTLLKHHVTINPTNQRGQTPLHYASVLSNNKCAMTLLLAGALLNIKDEFGMSPLHKTVGWGTLEMVKLFIHKGADTNALDILEQLPVHYSSLKGRTEITEFLLLKGSLLEGQDKNGQTPLHLAAKSGKVEIIKLLLLHGSDPNCQDIKGQSPLHLACCNGNKEAVQTLINRGASKNVVTTQGVTPDEFASERGFYGVLSVLREHRQSLSLYAPEQLKTFEMFRNATAPTRLESLGQVDDDDECDDADTEQPETDIMKDDGCDSRMRIMVAKGDTDGSTSTKEKRANSGRSNSKNLLKNHNRKGSSTKSKRSVCDAVSFSADGGGSVTAGGAAENGNLLATPRGGECDASHSSPSPVAGNSSSNVQAANSGDVNANHHHSKEPYGQHGGPGGDIKTKRDSSVSCQACCNIS